MVDRETDLVLLPSGPVEYRMVRGPGAAVVVFHGGHLRAGLPSMEDSLVADGYTVLIPSRPGYGRTPLSSGPGPARFARAAAELTSRLGLPSILAVVGVSAGGPTATAMAAAEPDSVRSLVLHSARSSLPFPTGPARPAALALFAPRFQAITWAAVRAVLHGCPRAGLASMLSSMSTLRGREVLADLSIGERQLVAEMFSTMRSGSGFANDVRQQVDPALERAVRQPTLVVASRRDGQVRWEHVEQYGRSIRQAVIWESPSSSHLIWYGSGGPATAARTAAFLRRVERGGDATRPG